jgi:hypothetical protein
MTMCVRRTFALALAALLPVACAARERDPATVAAVPRDAPVYFAALERALGPHRQARRPGRARRAR